MPMQGGLFGEGGAVSATPHRLFFALWPDDDVRDAIASRANALRERHRPDGRALNPARYHLTLPFLGDFDPFPDKAAARAMAAATNVRLPAFTLTLDRADGFANSRVWWLGPAETPAGLSQLWDALVAALLRERVRTVGAHSRTPHVTIQRDVRATLAAEPIAPLPWPVREFVLIDSQPPQPYRIVGRWALG